jgi:3-deoxy-D-manno-octulosonic acid (KDO) 8-phosphate synthase
MAFYDKTHDIPRDPEAIEASSKGGGAFAGFLTLAVVAVAAALLYLFVVGPAPEPRTVNAPSTTELAPPSEPATRPTTTP